MNWFGALKRYPEANFLQSPEWGKVNELAGYQVVVRSLGSHSYCQMIVKNAKRARYLEVPGGPLTDWRDHKKVADAVEQIRQVAKKYHCAFARVRPQLPDTEANRQLFAKLGFLTSSFMRTYRKHALIVTLIIAAIITPTSDAITLLLVSAPMFLLYEASIFIVKRTNR